MTKGDDEVRVTAMPAKHDPDPVAGMLPPTMDSLLDFSRDQHQAFRLYITGDTLLHDRLHDIPQRYPGIDLALVHAGGTTLLGTVVTMTGERASGGRCERPGCSGAPYRRRTSRARHRRGVSPPTEARKFLAAPLLREVAIEQPTCRGPRAMSLWFAPQRADVEVVGG